jgi:hypothetical protein
MRRTSKIRAALGLAAGLALGNAPVVAAAQAPSYATNLETIRGTISALTGKYTLTLADERGFTDNVTLHDGTVIGPAGFTLQAGAAVVITGHSDGPTFDADEVDRDDGGAQSDSGAPSAYGAYGSAYDGGGYPAYGAPYGYGFGYGSGYYGFGPGYYGFGPGYYGFGYPPYPGYYSCCFQPPGNRHSTVPVIGHSIPLPHQTRVGAPAGSSSSRSSYSGSRASSTGSHAASGSSQHR